MNHVSRERPEPDVALAPPPTNAHTPPTAMEGAAVSLAGHLVHLATRLQQIEALLARLLTEAQASGSQVDALMRHLTDLDARRALEERLAELTTRLEESQERLDELAQTVAKSGRIQFKANTLAETKEQQIAAALATLQEIIARREQMQEARRLDDQRQQEEVRRAARGELIADLLPALDSLDLAIENGQALLARLQRQVEEAARTTVPQPPPAEGVLGRLRQTLAGRPTIIVVPASPEPASEVVAALQAWLHGLALTRERFLRLLDGEGVQLIPAQGQPFDPYRHVAVEVETRSDVAPDTVVRVVRQGYRQGDRTLRYAEVIVSRAPFAGNEGGQTPA